MGPTLVGASEAIRIASGSTCAGAIVNAAALEEKANRTGSDSSEHLGHHLEDNAS